MPGHPADPSLAVVTVAYRSGAVLPRFLDSLAAATTRDYEMIIADNAAPDPEVQKLASRDVRVLDTGGNLGYGRAANRAIAQTRAPWVVVANPDIEWAAGSLDTLLDAAGRWPLGGAFGPAILTPGGELYPSARELPSLGRGVGHALLGWWWPRNPWTASYRREVGAPAEGPAGWLSGSCLLLRRVAFDAVGGFDPSYFMYFEDVDLAERLGRAGWLNVHVPDARVTHLGGHSAAQHAARMAVEHHDSAYRYLARRYAGPRWLPVRVLLRGGLAARARVAARVRSVAAGAAPQRRGKG